MPELPEVETVRSGLAATITGKRVAKVELRSRKLRQPVPEDLPATLKGREITAVERRAKYLLLRCSGGITLICHLGMSGSLIVSDTAPGPGKHDHVVLHWQGGGTLTYRDPRRFGLMLYCNTEETGRHPLLAALGPEPLAKTWGAKPLHASLQASRAPVKHVIMDQGVVVGVGNIYACEALFESGIHPLRPANKVTQAEAARLATSIKEVLRAAIASGGSTLRDYVRSSGDAGYFQHHFRVYGRKGEPCPACGHTVEALRQAGRSSFYCPHCQK